MKTEPTQLEQYQAARIAALESEVTRLNSQLITARRELMTASLQTDQAALKITVTDPNFLKPIHNVDYSNACRHDQFTEDNDGRLTCSDCNTPKYSI